ncbi:hypothetical protein BJY00DRAFT_310576 [Aspergillus carlsbadensis]|nr:hypothetical protein BJY00DRAFT_310576 [Aspergillus carlsbadensis]
MSWDLDLCLDIAGVPVTPFHYFVYPSTATVPPVRNAASFPRFTQLPLEIQSEIVHWCDLPTLFQLIHTSSRIRAISTKAFYRRLSQLWCYIEVTRPNRHDAIPQLTGRAFHCPEFARHITKLELSFRMSYWEMLSHSPNYNAPEKARMLWKWTQDLFPSVREVVLSGVMDDILVGGTPPTAPDRRRNSPYNSIEVVLREAPPHISALIALADRFGNPYQLWDWTGETERDGKAWVLLESSWTPKRVIIPARKLSPGVLRDLVTQDRKYWFWTVELKGLQQLTFGSYLRYAPETGIECAHAGCDAKFPLREDWDDHITTRCTFSAGLRQVRPSRHTPEGIKVVLAQRRTRAEHLHDQFTSLKKGFLDKCGEPHTDKREQFYACLPALLEEQRLSLPEHEDTLDSFEFTHQMYTGKHPVGSQKN